MRHSDHGGNEASGEGRGEGAEADRFAAFASGTPQRPFVVGQLGQSLDGRIATSSGDSKYINGEAALDHLHAIRARVDAVLVGVGTAIADDPMLTVRRVSGRDPARIVLDPNGRLPPQARLLADDGARRVVLRRASAGVPMGEGVEIVTLADGPVDPHAIVKALGSLGFARILVEGGARTLSSFVDAGALDRLHVLVAPLLIGSGIPGLDLRPIVGLDEALRPRSRAYLLDDGDVLFDCDLRAAAEKEFTREPEREPTREPPA